jgi:glycine/serine hydroxymethyltransferase
MESEMRSIGSFINKVISNPEDEKIKNEVASDIKELCKKFPLYNK